MFSGLIDWIPTTQATYITNFSKHKTDIDDGNMPPVFGVHRYVPYIKIFIMLMGM